MASVAPHHRVQPRPLTWAASYASASTSQVSTGLLRRASSSRPVSDGASLPCNYIRVPFGLLNVAASYQRFMQGALAAHKARRQAVLAEEALDPRKLSGPPEPSGP